MPAADPDLPLRQAAVAQARRLAELYDDLVPLTQLRAGFAFDGERVSFGSFQKGIHRARIQRGLAALTLTTSLKDPYGDAYDEGEALFKLTRIAPARPNRPTIARSAPPTSSARPSSTSARWRPGNTS